MGNNEYKVEVLNRLIEAANKNGGDLGGSYNQCMEDLYEAINSALYEFDLKRDYCIIETHNWNCFSPYRIEKKKPGLTQEELSEIFIENFCKG